MVVEWPKISPIHNTISLSRKEIVTTQSLHWHSATSLSSFFFPILPRAQTFSINSHQFVPCRVLLRPLFCRLERKRYYRSNTLLGLRCFLRHAHSARTTTESPIILLPLPPAGCRAPPSPVNGSIEEYRSTEEGAEIQFHCHDGYTPNERMSSQCLNSSWSPQPMDLVCVLPDPDDVTPDPDDITSDPNSQWFKHAVLDCTD